MLRLPKLAAGDSSWNLPLSSQGATELLELLLVDDHEQRLQQCSELLAVEPPLSLWVAARGFADEAPCALSDLSTWLAQHAGHAFAGAVTDDPNEAPQIPACAQLAEAVVSAAHFSLGEQTTEGISSRAISARDET